MSATHIGIASGAVMPESFAMLSHFEACVPRRSMTRLKSNMWQRLRVGSGGKLKLMSACGAGNLRVSFGRHLVTRILDRARAHPPPDQHDIVVRGVVEA